MILEAEPKVDIFPYAERDKYIHHILHKYLAHIPKETPQYSREDLVQEGHKIIVRWLPKYDGSVAKSTFFYRRIYGAIIDYTRSVNKTRAVGKVGMVSLEMLTYCDTEERHHVDTSSHLDNSSFTYLDENLCLKSIDIDSLFSLVSLTKIQELVIRDRHYLGLTFPEMAIKYNITKGGVHKRYSSAMNHLQDTLRRLKITY